MLNIPINLYWGDKKFKYLVSMSSETEGSSFYQYKTHINQDDSSVDSVQLVCGDYDNLEKENNVYYPIPFQYENYRFTLYSPDGLDRVSYGILEIDNSSLDYILLKITDCEDSGLIGSEFSIRTHDFLHNKIELYDETNTTKMYMIYIYENDYNVQYLPNDPNSDNFIITPSRKVIFRLPWYKINNYRDTDYALKFSTWVSGTEVILGCYRITKDNHIATPYTIYKEDRYVECVEFYIPDPWSLIYKDIWKDWRQAANICDEPEDLNNTGSSLNVSLTPIEYTGEYYNIISSGNIGCSNISISKLSDFMHLDIGFNENSSNIEFRIKYNSAFDSLQEYLKETYLIDIPTDSISTHYELAVIDKEEEYGVLEMDVTPEYIDENTQTTITDVTNIEHCVFLKNDLGLQDWANYKPGLFLAGSVAIQKDDIDVFYIASDPIPLTPEIYKYLIYTDIDGLKLNFVNMIEYTVNAVNKINKEIVQVENAKDYKSNIIRPVFFRAYDINTAIIHPEVTENICLNINAYKSKVDYFYLKIEGVIFQEIGRNPNGVIFKIQGNMLPHQIEEGLMYVLNQDKELVTTGQFKYMS